jgi:hypothetical protein
MVERRKRGAPYSSMVETECRVPCRKVANPISVMEEETAELQVRCFSSKIWIGDGSKRDFLTLILIARRRM